MARRARIPVRLEIVGLNPKVFDACVKSTQALLEAKLKGYSESRADNESASVVEVVSPGGLEIHKKIASIAIDFQRAYGRSVEVRVFERSSNRFVELISKSRRRAFDSLPEFFINGVLVFKGVPQSFSQLDEAIDRAFERNTQT